MGKDFYGVFKEVKPEPSTSSYGRWIVRTSEVSIEYFWDKAGAMKYASQHNKGMAKMQGIPQCDSCNVMLNYNINTMKYTCPSCSVVYSYRA